MKDLFIEPFWASIQGAEMPNNIIFFYGGFRKNAGGAFLHAELLNQKFQLLGYNSKIISLDDLPLLIKYLPHLVYHIALKIVPAYAFIIKGKITGLLYKFFFAKDDAKYIFEDIYISWSGAPKALILLHAVWSDNLQSYKLNDKELKKLKYFEEKIIRKLSGSLVTVSYPYRDYLVNKHFLNVSKNDIGVIHLGRDIPAEIKQGLTYKKRTKSIVAAGLLEKRKNYRHMLQVFKDLISKDNSYRLTIIGGDGGELYFLKQYVDLHKLPVTFTGKLDYLNTLEEISRHEFFLHSSTKESFSFALLEAKMLGLKTIAFEKLEVPEEFIDVKVKDFNVSRWVDAIQAAPHCSSLVLSDYSVDRLANETLEFLYERK